MTTKKLSLSRYATARGHQPFWRTYKPFKVHIPCLFFSFQWRNNAEMPRICSGTPGHLTSKTIQNICVLRITCTIVCSNSFKWWVPFPRRPDNLLLILSYSDASYDMCRGTRRRISGMVTLASGTPIDWSCKRQTSVISSDIFRKAAATVLIITIDSVVQAFIISLTLSTGIIFIITRLRHVQMSHLQNQHRRFMQRVVTLQQVVYG